MSDNDFWGWINPSDVSIDTVNSKQNDGGKSYHRTTHAQI